MASALLLAAAGAIAQSTPSLRKYIQVRHLDIGTPPLIAIDIDHQFMEDGAPIELSGYGRRLVRVGGLNVITLARFTEFHDEDVPNPYDALDEVDKMEFLLASLSRDELQRLGTIGICADDLQGEPRSALLSLLPKPFTFTVSEADGIGGSSSYDESPKTLAPEQLGQVRLQLQRGVQVTFNAMSDGKGGSSAQSVRSLDFQAPNGAKIAQTDFESEDSNRWSKGHVVAAYEKPSEINWNDPLLARSVKLPASWSIADAFANLTTETGLDLQVDTRIASQELDCFGSQVKAADLLRGITLAVGGVMRRVGNVYLLSPNVEGEQTKETRVRAKLAMGKISIQSRVDAWKAAVKSRRLYELFGFSPKDAFGAANIPAADFAKDDDMDFENGWVPLSQVPASIRSAISQAPPLAVPSNEVDNAASVSPNPPLKDKVKLNTCFGYRFVLPNGLATLFQPLFNDPTPVTPPNAPDRVFPLAFSKLPAGSAVGFKSDDPAAVSRICSLCKKFGVTRIWLESLTPAAIQAATGSGLKVDLLIHPWWVLPGETGYEPDRTVLGMTGSQLDQIPEATIDGDRRLTRHYHDSVALDSNLVEHEARLLHLLPKSGVDTLILEDASPNGYQAPVQVGANGGLPMLSSGGLGLQVPDVFEFGYSENARIQFIREHSIDPVDLLQPMIEQLLPAAPYFEPSAAGEGSFDSDYPPAKPVNPDFYRQWQVARYQAGDQALNHLFTALAPLHFKLFVEAPTDRAQYVQFPFRTFVSKPGEAGDSDNLVTLNPRTAEDADGNVIYQPDSPLESATCCLDLSDVPTDRIETYLKHLFTPVKN